MAVDIYIKEKSGKREIRIPWIPEEITFESGDATMATYDILNKGEVVVPTGSGLSTVSWKSEFPGKQRTDSSMMRGKWQDPKTYHSTLEDWKENGTLLNVLVTGYPINIDVYIESYKGAAAGGFGDWSYEIKLVEYREIKISSTKVTSTSSSKETKRTSTSSASYTVKKGDTLWKIAAMKQHYGKGAQWKKIYNANKEIIEKTAKKYRNGKGSENGHWIYPGTKLKIPAASANAGNTSEAKKKYTLEITNQGRQSFRGSYVLYLDGKVKRSGPAKDYTCEVTKNTKVKIVAYIKEGRPCEISDPEFVMSRDTFVYLKWKEK